jgi:hypothetical protein
VIDSGIEVAVSFAVAFFTVRTGGSAASAEPVEVIRKLGGQWPDRKVAVTMN